MMAPDQPEKGIAPQPFQGFEHLTANFIYCPNQFFDVCLPNCSLVGLRTVGHVLYRTLSWLDENGQPIEEHIVTPQSALVSAGVSKGSAKKGIHESLEGRFLQCTQQAAATANGKAAQSAVFSLRWSDNSDYTTDKQQFDGFFAGEGCRTPVPKEFFTDVLVHQPHSVIKFVGTVLRHTVGYQSQFGGRRREAPVSISFFQRYAKVRDRATAIQSARLGVERGFVDCVSIGKQSTRTPAHYALKWRPVADGNEGLPESQPDGSEIQPVPSAVQKSNRMQPNNPTRVDPKIQPVLGQKPHQQRLRKPTNIKNFQKELLKQQHKEVAAVDSVDSDSNPEPLDELAASQLVREYHRLRFGVGDCQPQPHEVKHAAALLATDDPDELRRLLPEVVRLVQQHYKAEDLYFGAAVPYFGPAARKHGQLQHIRAKTERHGQQQNSSAAVEAKQRQQRQQRRTQLISRWSELSTSEQRRIRKLAIDQAASETVRQRLQRHRDLDAPATETLETMANALTLAIGD